MTVLRKWHLVRRKDDLQLLDGAKIVNELFMTPVPSVLSLDALL